MSYRKALTLSIFSLFTIVNGFAWLMFDPSVTYVEALFEPYVTNSTIRLLSSWQPLLFLVTVLPWAKLLTQPDGLRRAIRIGASFQFSGAVFKVAASCMETITPTSVLLLHAGQIMSAVSGPVAIGAPPLVSALWFEPEERTRSTAVAVLSNNIGNGIAYLAVPLLCVHFGNYQAVLFLELIGASFSFLLSMVLLPRPRPQGYDRVHSVTGDSEAMDTNSPEPLGVFQQLKLLFMEPSALLLLVVYAWTSGGAVAWTSMFDQVLPANGYDDVLVGQISLWSTVAYVVGGLVSAQITDMYFQKNMKFVIVSHTLVNAAFCLMFALCVREPFLGGRTVFQVNAFIVLFLASACGWCSGGAAPVFYELLAEITYPVNEAISGNLMSMAENAGSLIMYQVVVRVFGSMSINAVYAIGLWISVACMMAVKERHKRREAAEGRPAGREDDDDEEDLEGQEYEMEEVRDV